jgi:hypothetical protein
MCRVKHSWFSFLFIVFVAVVGTFLTLASRAYSANVTLAWDPNSESDLAGYRLYYGEDNALADDCVDVGDTTTYTVASLAEGRTYYFDVTAYDTHGNESLPSEQVRFTVPENPPANSPPLAHDGNLNVDYNTTACGSLNAYDPEGDALTFQIVDNGTLGNAIITHAATGTFTYTPHAGASGSDYFTFKVNDGACESNLATVSVLIGPPPNTRPVAYDGNLNVDCNTTAIGTLSAQDPEGDALTFEIVSNGALGTATITDSAKGTFTYSTREEALGLDCFTFKANDGTCDSNVATVSVVIAPPPDTDGDGMTDTEEQGLYGTDPCAVDTDGDGIGDGDEVAFWGAYWNRDYDGDGLVNLLDADSDGDGMSDGSELLAGLDPAKPNPGSTALCLETGELTIDHNWHHVTFGQPFIAPVVIATPLSGNGGQPAVVRVAGIDSNGFDICIQEWDYLDGTHVAETVGYLVMEQGTYALHDGTRIEAGTAVVNGRSFHPLPFTNAFQVPPVIVTTVCSVNEPEAVTTRVRKMTTAGFECCLQEQEKNRQDHREETISYVAWEPSAGSIDGLMFEAGTTADAVKHNKFTLSFGQKFVNAPVFLAAMQTSDGGDTANVRWKNKDPFCVRIWIDEEQSRDRETRHTKEVVGYLVFDEVTELK